MSDDRGSHDPRLQTPLNNEQFTRLRAVLRFVLDERDADQVVARAIPRASAYAAYRTVAGGVRQRLLTGSLRARVGRGDPADPNRPFPENRSTSVRPAIALCLHLALDLDGEALTSVLGGSPEELGDDLLTARRAVDPACPRPCSRYASAIGRYRDPRLDTDDRLELLGHAKGCENCRRTMDFIRRLDDDLVGELDRIEASLAPLPPAAPRRLPVRRIASAAGGALVIVLAVAGLAALLNRATAGDTPPVPLAAGSTAAYEGWLLGVGPGGRIDAYDLATGETVIVREGGEGLSAYASISPDNQTVALWDPEHSPTDVGNAAVEFATLAGERVSVYTWDSSEWYQYPGGWLGPETMLVVANPAYTPDMDQDAFEELARTRGRLVAVSARTGEFRELLVGDVGSATPSPDGRMVAVLSSYAMNRVGQTLTLYPVSNGELGAPVVAIEERVRSQPVWSTDGGTLVVSRVTDGEMQRRESSGRGEGASLTVTVTVELVGLDRTGELKRLTPNNTYLDAYPLAVGTGGDTVLFTSRSSPSLPPNEMWLKLSSDELQPFLPNSGASAWSFPAWSPDGAAFVVQTTLESYASSEAARGEISTLAIIVVNPNGSHETIRTSFSWSSSNVFAWVPKEAISRPAFAASSGWIGHGYDLEPVADLEAGDVLVSAGTIAVNNSHPILADGDLGVPLIWDGASGSARRLGFDIEQLRWSGGGRELLGVQRGSPSGRIGSRLVYVPEPLDALTGGGQPTSVAFDPALLGADQLRRYARPLFSPDGNHLAFFILNPESGIGEVWLAGWERPAAPIARWKLAPDALLDFEIAATWIDQATLLFAQPANWERGLPRRVEVMRVVVSESSNPVVERVASIAATGAERGIVMRDIVISPDGTEIVWRIRHYKEHSANRGRVDSIDVVSASDVNARLEVARANSGDGLSWSPDGSWLVAGLDRRVALLSPNGIVFEYLTPDGSATESPLWVGNDEVWFNMDGDGGLRVWRVRIE